MADNPAAASSERKLWPAVRNGLLCRCPQCGRGKLYRKYLKIRDRCEACGLDMHHHRADDLPPYIAITIVGHILVAFLLHAEMAAPLSAWTYMMILVPAAIILPLAMLPSIKGAVVGIQWAQRMHGFGRRPDAG